LNAALVAAKAGAEVILIEQESLLGGSLNYSRFDVDGTVAFLHLISLLQVYTRVLGLS